MARRRESNSPRRWLDELLTRFFSLCNKAAEDARFFEVFLVVVMAGIVAWFMYCWCTSETFHFKTADWVLLLSMFIAFTLGSWRILGAFRK